MNGENELGIIAPGYLADFAVLDRDYFEVPEKDIGKVSSVLTVMNGKVVFGAQDYSKLSPRMPGALPSWSPLNYYGGYHGTK
jgi:hypothetical protein